MNWNDEPLLICGAGSSSNVTAEIAGSKAAQLWRMAQLGLDVPPAFVMPTNLCQAVNSTEQAAIGALERGLRKGITWLEQATGRGFGDSRKPLLVSVRSGAAISMPGMLDTVLNIGLNDQTVHGLIRLTGNPRLAFDSYRRLVQSYAEVVEQVAGREFEHALEAACRREGAAGEVDLDPDALEQLTIEFREVMLRQSSRTLPEDPQEQLRAAALAVYRSWGSARAREYRKLNHITDLQGTAVTVQAMVFGNSGGRSGAGVAFSRNPATGAKEPYVDFVFDAQGEDVVSGRRTPSNAVRLAERLPEAAKRLTDGIAYLEREFRDMQDVEFTIEDGRLYFLQTRSAKRTPRAALRIAVDMVREGLIDTGAALARLANLDAQALCIARFAEPAQAIAVGIPASPGVASGRVAFNTDQARKLASGGDPVILVRQDTSTDDVEGFALAAGILTAVGGRTAHAAVVARQLGKVCLVGCRSLTIDESCREATIGKARIHAGDWLSLDGDRAEITQGKRAIATEPPPELQEVERWRTPSGAAEAATLA